MADQIAYLHEQMGCQDQQIWDMSMGFMLLLMVIPLLTQGFALDTQAPNARECNGLEVGGGVWCASQLSPSLVKRLSHRYLCIPGRMCNLPS
jgi:hypothetical protein